ncbi:MAG: DUF2089 domain-containing protein [candidate division Zixibacteria bacterium]|nr:DUF2089 domain-containing protein [candidate division Zixibacteria bacterium]
MNKEWQELTKMTGGEPVIVERVRLTKSDIVIEGKFELPPLAKLTMEDQIFVAAFVKSHGSIKQMEQTFGVSYPTIKNRLNRIGENFDFVHIESVPSGNEVLSELESGEITVEEALKRLKQ